MATSTLEDLLARLREAQPGLERTEQVVAPLCLRLWDWPSRAEAKEPEAKEPEAEKPEAEKPEAEKPEVKLPDVWARLLLHGNSATWTAEAMLCTAPPERPPVPEPTDKEEFERLKKADPSFERNYYCSYTEAEREKAYERARACEAARARVYELAREDAGSDAMGEHLRSMIMDYGLGATPEFEIGCAYSQQYNSMDEFALYMQVMPDFLDRHYDAGSCWARDELIREAKRLLNERLPECQMPSSADDDLYA